MAKSGRKKHRMARALIAGSALIGLSAGCAKSPTALPEEDFDFDFDSWDPEDWGLEWRSASQVIRS